MNPRIEILEQACALTARMAFCVADGDWEVAAGLVAERSALLQTLPPLPDYAQQPDGASIIELEGALIGRILAADREMNTAARVSRDSLASRIERERMGRAAGDAYLAAASS